MSIRKQAIYIAEIYYFYKNNGFVGNKTKAYIMSQKNSVDIDTELDFNLCEILLNTIMISL